MTKLQEFYTIIVILCKILKLVRVHTSISVKCIARNILLLLDLAIDCQIDVVFNYYMYIIGRLNFGSSVWELSCKSMRIC